MRLHLIALSVSCGLLFGGTSAAAQTQGTAAGYRLYPEHTRQSPDGKTTIEQYAKFDTKDGYTWQVWARRGDERRLLAPEQADYPAGFRFTADWRWLVRMQKTGSGEQSLYLYWLGPRGFVAATRKPLSEFAWAFFMSRPDGKMTGMPDYHISAGLVKGTEENYRWVNVQWPENRYLVIYLSGAISSNDEKTRDRSLYGWHCRYDLQKGAFDVPPEFAENNAKAIAQAITSRDAR
jgi:hypothetical protein